MACVALATLISGCGGINASGSVSPASFLLPGILHRTPPAKAPDDIEKLEPGIVRVEGASGPLKAREAMDVSQL